MPRLAFVLFCFVFVLPIAGHKGRSASIKEPGSGQASTCEGSVGKEIITVND